MTQQNAQSDIDGDIPVRNEAALYQNIHVMLPDYSCGDVASPPPPYEEICTSSFVEHNRKCVEEENPYEIIPDQQAPTANPCDPGCAHAFTAPDIFMEHQKKVKEPFQALVNGKIVDYITMPVLTHAEGKKCLVQNAEKLTKFSTKAAQDCCVCSSKYKAVFRYKLQSLIELRTFVDMTKPYRGEDPGHCHVLHKWEYQVNAPIPFVSGERYFKIRNTEKISTCKTCKGGGKEKCEACRGCGRITCNHCHGSGRETISSTDCLHCSGGFEICYECRGGRNARCRECHGKGKVIAYKRLKVTWVVKEHRYVDETHGIPKKLLTKAVGRQVFFEESDGLSKPIQKSELLHPEIATVSERFISKCRESRGVVIRKQRQTVDIVLIQQFNCRHKTKEFSFYLVGTNHAFHTPNCSCC